MALCAPPTFEQSSSLSLAHATLSVVLGLQEPVSMIQASV